MLTLPSSVRVYLAYPSGVASLNGSIRAADARLGRCVTRALFGERLRPVRSRPQA
jgi:hypothetical protein